jgi:hypothetical protein
MARPGWTGFCLAFSGMGIFMQHFQARVFAWADIFLSGIFQGRELLSGIFMDLFFEWVYLWTAFLWAVWAV